MTHYFIFTSSPDSETHLIGVWNNKRSAQAWLENADFTCYMSVYVGDWNMGVVPSPNNLTRLDLDTFIHDKNTGNSCCTNTLCGNCF